MRGGVFFQLGALAMLGEQKDLAELCGIVRIRICVHHGEYYSVGFAPVVTDGISGS